MAVSSYEHTGLEDTLEYVPTITQTYNPASATLLTSFKLLDPTHLRPVTIILDITRRTSLATGVDPKKIEVLPAGPRTPELGFPRYS